jgi:hypothetical protein
VHEGGDVHAVARNYFSSDPIKQSSVKAALGDDEWAKHYTVFVKPILKEGKPTREKKLIKSNVNFEKPRRLTPPKS